MVDENLELLLELLAAIEILVAFIFIAICAFILDRKVVIGQLSFHQLRDGQTRVKETEGALYADRIIELLIVEHSAIASRMEDPVAAHHKLAHASDWDDDHVDDDGGDEGSPLDLSVSC